jgi:hypothetical protein
MLVHTVSAKDESKVDSFDTFWACWTFRLVTKVVEEKVV